MGYVVNKRRFKQSGPPKYKVSILVWSSHITHTGGDLVQSNLSGPMVPVTLTPDDTYKLNQGAGTYSGITVEVSGRNLVISGTPTANVSIPFTASQNADVLTSTQKNFANWTKSSTYSYGFLFYTGVDSTYIPWRVREESPIYGKNEGYYYDLSSLPTDTQFQFSLTYKVETVGSFPNSGCKIGISTDIRNGFIHNNMLGSITIPTTQAEYVTETVNITRPSGSNCYLAIFNTAYTSQYYHYDGKIHVSNMYLRQL